MTDRKSGADRAWEVLQEVGPRGFGPSYANPHKAKSLFLSKVERDPATGCWMWTGSVSNGKYPVHYEYDPGAVRAKKRSAFVWMMSTWFPDVKMPGNVKGTSPTCGRLMCINPRHRRAYVPDHVYKLTPDQVRQIFAEKGKRRPGEVAAEHGIASCTVWRIWSGKQQADVTGLKKPVKVYRKLTPKEVKTIYSRAGTVSKASLAREYGVNPTTIGHIWSGRTWSNVTGASLPQ